MKADAITDKPTGIIQYWLGCHYRSRGKEQTMSKNEEDRFIYVSDEYIKELQQKAKEAEYFRGRVHGLEYVIDTLGEILKGADDDFR